MRFLVTAATGTTSAGVVRHLRSADEEVRGLVRDKDTATRTFDDLHGVDIVDGAFDDDVVLAKAFRGVKLHSWPWEVAPIRSGWRRPSSTARCKPDYHTWSSCRASQPATTPPCFVGRLHAEIQDHLAASGLSYTLLHPASFANNLFYKAESVAESIEIALRQKGRQRPGRVLHDSRTVPNTEKVRRGRSRGRRSAGQSGCVGSNGRS